MDPSLALEEITQDISNLDAEFRYMLEEIRGNDLEIFEKKKKYQQKEILLDKYIKQHGSISEYPQEKEVNKDIGDGIASVIDLQKEKCILANTALFLGTRHLSKLERIISLLEEDGVLAPLEDEVESGTDMSRENSVLSVASERKRRAPSSGSSVGPANLKKKKHNRSSSITKQADLTKQQSQPPQTAAKKNITLSPVPITDNEVDPETQKYNDELFSAATENEEEDKTLYCFCQSVSYGEMVACDGPSCKYEWFHYSCVNLKEPPKGTWYCPDCKQEMLKNKSLKKRKA